MQKQDLLKAGLAFDYDHISLVPRVVSTLQHRADASPEVLLGNCRLRLPLIGSPMSDVCGTEMCSVLSHEGAASLLHRFQGVRSQARAFKEARGREAHAAVGAAIGVTNSYQEQFQLLYEAGCRLFCLDTANGAHKQVEHAIAWIHHVSDDIFLIAGNVASAETFSWLEDLGVDAIRVGIAGGSVCETRTETGVYVPTPYAVAEVAAVRKRAMIIGDGGVRTPSDFCKLLALGADVVMLGSALAGTQEAPGQIVMADGKQYKIMRGSASFSVQQQGGKETPEYVEGTETLVPYRGSVVAVLHRYMAGLRSSMSYMNARTLEEYRNNASFVLLR